MQLNEREVQQTRDLESFISFHLFLARRLVLKKGPERGHMLKEIGCMETRLHADCIIIMVSVQATEGEEEKEVEEDVS